MSKDISMNLQGLSRKTEYNNYRKLVEQINTIKFDSYNNEEIRNKSNELKAKVRQGSSTDEIVIEAFALVKEAIKRVLGLSAFDEQLIAGLAMYKGRLIEMQTGEGKTLTAVFTAYVNALSGLGCHILTFNDYLARRDALWMGPVYEMLGLTVGFVQDNMKRHDRQRAYSCDITYVTAKVAGFDYLRDLLCYDKNELVQRSFNFAIIDEADSIIIDEARIPLVIAAMVNDGDNTLCLTMAAIKKLEFKVDYDKDEFKNNVYLTEAGLDHLEGILCCDNLYADENFTLLSEVHNCLYAEALLRKDIDYIVRDGKIEMVDEFTGRIAENRHWPDGIQAALETKEDLGIQAKGRIMNQLTLQSFILLYKNTAGMTATAIDSAEEIKEFYGMEVFVIPPHIPCMRKDYPDVIFTHKEAKFKALIAEIVSVNAKGQPILIGTCSVEESEYLAEELNKVNVSCEVLNAKNDEIEISIIEKAGVFGAVTVSTNMAGRGADIKLGGTNENNKKKILELGGLYVIGTNRHESIRIDKQLRGRAGRQGDVGMSKFFISLEDNILNKYDINKVIPVEMMPAKSEEPINNKQIGLRINQIQRIIQGKDSDLRRALWQYSTLVEAHRLQVHERRMEILLEQVPFNILIRENQELHTKLTALFGDKIVMELEKQVTLFNIDEVWADYLVTISQIREGIHLKVIGGKSPIREFQTETDNLFKELNQDITERVLSDFENMELSEKGLIALRERIKPPSSTWTYLVNDRSLVEGLSLALIGNGALGMFFGGPIYFVAIILGKIKSRIKGIFKG